MKLDQQFIINGINEVNKITTTAKKRGFSGAKRTEVLKIRTDVMNEGMKNPGVAANIIWSTEQKGGKTKPWAKLASFLKTRNKKKARNEIKEHFEVVKKFSDKLKELYPTTRKIRRELATEAQKGNSNAKNTLRAEGEYVPFKKWMSIEEKELQRTQRIANNERAEANNYKQLANIKEKDADIMDILVDMKQEERLEKYIARKNKQSEEQFIKQMKKAMDFSNLDKKKN